MVKQFLYFSNIPFLPPIFPLFFWNFTILPPIFQYATIFSHKFFLIFLFHHPISPLFSVVNKYHFQFNKYHFQYHHHIFQKFFFSITFFKYCNFTNMFSKIIIFFDFFNFPISTPIPPFSFQFCNYIFQKF